MLCVVWPVHSVNPQCSCNIKPSKHELYISVYVTRVTFLADKVSGVSRAITFSLLHSCVTPAFLFGGLFLRPCGWWLWQEFVGQWPLLLYQSHRLEESFQQVWKGTERMCKLIKRFICKNETILDRRDRWPLI